MSADSVYVGPVDLPAWAWGAIEHWYDTQYCGWDLGEYMDRMFGPPPEFKCTVDTDSPLDKESGYMGCTCGCCGDDYDWYDNYWEDDYEDLYLDK